MKQFIDFYMVVISPWCYLGLNRLISISKTYDIEINIKSKTIDERTLTAQSLLGLCLRTQR